MTQPRKLRVFLCHASQDKPIVRELYHRLLVETWIDPWLDEERLLPGQEWDLEIENAVERADAVIVCLSNNSVTKEGYIQKELRVVLDMALGKPEGIIFVIPLRLDDCQPPRRVRTWHYLDYFPHDQIETAHRKLLQSLYSRKRTVEIQNRIHINTDEMTAISNARFQEKKENQSSEEFYRSISFLLSVSGWVVFFIGISIVAAATRSYNDGGANQMSNGLLGVTFFSPLITLLLAAMGILSGIVEWRYNKSKWTKRGMIISIVALVVTCLCLLVMTYSLSILNV